jgi:hypothetical protein
METKSTVEAADDVIIFYHNWVQLFSEFVGRALHCRFQPVAASVAIMSMLSTLTYFEVVTN